MCEMTLCDGEFDGVSIHRVAYIKDSKLHVDGQDLCKPVGEFWGENEYEYFYTFSNEMTSYFHTCLKRDLNSDEKLLDLVARYFSGESGDKKLRHYCEIKSIEYEFFNYC